MIPSLKLAAFILGLALIVSPVLADGTLTVTKGSLSTPGYINTLTVTPVVNMTLSVTGGTVSLTAINISLPANTATYGNISGIFIYNDSDNNGVIGSGDLKLGNSTFDSGGNSSISLSFSASAGTNYYFIIALNTSPSATSTSYVGLNLTSNASIYTSSNDNITITGGHIESGLSQIQSVHANAAISPNYVDTNVTNQTLAYTIIPTGNDKINNISVVIPAGYSLVNVTSVLDSGTCLRGSCSQHPNLTVSFTPGGYLINVNYTNGYSGTAVINFTVNTNLSYVAQAAFNSTVTGSNLSNIVTDVPGNTSVTTKNIITSVSIASIKTAAYANGTDYWEFNFTFTFNASVTGLLHFKMNNWTDASGNTINLSSGTTNYATLRYNSSNYINVSQAYTSAGVLLTGQQGGTKNVILKMIIPESTPLSSSWWTIYSLIFRSVSS